MLKRIAVLLTAVLFLVPALFSCVEPGPATDVTSGDDVNTQDPNNTTEVTDVVTTASEYVENDVGTQNFGKKINILFWEDVERHEFFIEDYTPSGDRVDDAIYERNIAVEEQLGIELEWVGTPGSYNYQNDFVNACKRGNENGDHDIFAGYSLTASTIALNGLSQDLTKLEYLDFEKPWWPKSITEQATINDKLFFASGDISTMMLHMMYCVLFNKDLLAELQLQDEDPYEKVLQGTWTIKTMMKMCQNAYEDIGETAGKKDSGDRYGYVSTSINFDGIYIGCGLKVLDIGEDGKIIVSPDYTSEEAIDLCALCNTFFAENNAYCQAGDITSVPATQIFAEGRSLFTMDRAYITSSATFRGVGEGALTYGIVPCPKLKASQPSYVTMLGFPYTLYSISSASKNPNEAAATLECLGAYGYKKVTPELYETVMKVKYTSDDVSSGMYDLIRSTVQIDLGRIFSTELQNYTYSTFRSTLSAAKKDYGTVSKAREKQMMDTYLAPINELFAD